MSATQTRRSRPELAEAAIHAARQIMAQHGPAAFNARALAEAVGCSVGTLYNLFPNLDVVRLHVNGRTMDLLLAAVAEADDRAVAAGQDTPEERLLAQSRAYIAFAAQYRNLYEALLDRPASTGDAPPDWYMAKIAALRRRVEAAIASLFDPADTIARERAATIVWASVNGLGDAAVKGNLRSITQVEPDWLILDLIRTLVAGMRARQGR